MRALILTLSLLGILAGAHSAQAGLSTAPRETPASVDTANSAEEANQQTEDQIGLTRTKRRDVQRGLSRLGFDTRVNGKFDDKTRGAIARWQEQHGYASTGFLNATQHTALLSESVAAAEADRADRQEGHRGGRRAHRSPGVGGPIGVIGHVVGGLFRR